MHVQTAKSCLSTLSVPWFPIQVDEWSAFLTLSATTDHATATFRNWGLPLIVPACGPGPTEVHLNPTLESQEFNSRLLSPVHLNICLSAFFLLCFHCLSALPAHSPAFFHTPLQPVILSEVRFRMWLSAQWQNSHISKILTNAVTHRALTGEQRRRNA